MDVSAQVIKLLSETDLPTLIQVCSDNSIDISPANADEKTQVLRFLLKHLFSDTVADLEDQGHSLFLKIQTDLSDIF